MNSSNVDHSPSAEMLEKKSKRHPNLNRIRDRCRQMFNSTRQSSGTRRYLAKSSTVVDSSSEDLNCSMSPQISSKNRLHQHQSRRLSMIKIQFSTEENFERKSEEKCSIPSTSPNLLQKLLYRQFSPKTRPYSSNVSSDEIVSPMTTPNVTPTRHLLNSNATTKTSWTSSSSSTNSKQSVLNDDETLISTKTLSKSEQHHLNSSLSKRRNTTGSISLNKIVDLKNTSSGNALLVVAASSSNNSNQKVPNDNIFQTIEDCDLLATKQLIQSNEILLHSSNEFDWFPLDVAMMMNHIPMIRLLLHYGAEESPKIQPEEVRYQSVCQQLTESKTEDSNKKSSPHRFIPDDIQGRRSSPSNEKQQRQRQLARGSLRRTTLFQMKDNYEQADAKKARDFYHQQRRIPDPPTNVRLMVTACDQITVTFDEPLRSHGSMVIKYKIEWSPDEDFSQSSSDIIKNCFLREYVIRNLPMGQKCYVRVSAGNIKGFGPAALANPTYCVPSNCRELSKTCRTSVCDLSFEEILTRILNEKEKPSLNRTTEGNESPDFNQLKNRRRSYGNLRRNIRQLFQLYPRLAKTMRRGLYLVSVMLNGDRILVTNEDVLPMVEVDENYGHNLLADFQWFFKLTFVWDDLKSLKADLERSSSATSFYLRIKLVQAAIELQSLEEINNLGRLHHSYIRDSDGNVAFVLINDLSSETRSNICSSNLKWITMNKFFEMMRESEATKNNSSLQQIIEQLPEMIDFYQASTRRLDAGLYVAYLKMQNSVDSIRVMVNKYIPGSLPCTKIRSIANVSREEWQWLHRTNQDLCAETDENNLTLFKEQFRQATKELFTMLDLPETHFSNSRIYDSQVVEIRDDLSLIILMSTADEVNFLSKASNHFSSSFLYLPVYIFEVLQHLSNNYRFICQYSRVSICLDFELISAQQNQREAFSNNELDESRTRLNHLLSCQQDLDEIWRSARWLVHVINCAKDKTYSGISLKSFHSTTTMSLDSADQYSLIDDDPEQTNSLQLTFYLPSEDDPPIQLDLHPSMKLNEIRQLISEQPLFSGEDSSKSIDLLWFGPNDEKSTLDENLTAIDLHKRFQQCGGRIHLRHRTELQCTADL